MADRIIKSLGHYGFWGLSGTFDFAEAISNTPRGPDLATSQEPIRILLLQAGDIRHVVTTMSRRRRNPLRGRPIHFYVMENLIEIIARDILLLEVLNDFEVPIRQRANIFLEIYGNVKVQDRTNRYIEQLGYQLRSLVVHGKGRQEDMIDFSLLKYRERDELENVFKGYARTIPFDIDTLWDQRLRGYYAERYDSRKSLADWDWQYSIKDTASIIHVKLYKDWRLRGIAFEFGDQMYTEPNRTLMASAPGVMKIGKDKGFKKAIQGYWSDVVVSPYFTFGYDSETPNAFARGLYEILNKGTGTEQHRHHVVEIAVYNLLSSLWEIEMGEEYLMTKANDIFSGLGSNEQGKLKKKVSTDSTAVEEKGQEVKGNGTGNSCDADTDYCHEHVDEDKLTEENKKQEKGETEKMNENEKAIEENDENSILRTEADETNAMTTEEEIKLLSQELLRAERIGESLDHMKIFPLVGEPSVILAKTSKYSNFFDGIFLSMRSAAFMQSEVADQILKPGALIAVETGKFLISYTKQEKTELLKKEHEMAHARGWRLMEETPVSRRARDEADIQVDVMFFEKPDTDKDNIKLAESVD